MLFRYADFCGQLSVNFQLADVDILNLIVLAYAELSEPCDQIFISSVKRLEPTRMLRQRHSLTISDIVCYVYYHVRHLYVPQSYKVDASHYPSKKPLRYFHARSRVNTSVCRGVTLFQKVGVTNFRRRRGGGVWWGGCAPSPENFSLLTLEKVHFGGYLMHSDVLILKLWFAVHRMLHGSATNYVSVFLWQAAVHSWGWEA